MPDDTEQDEYGNRSTSLSQLHRILTRLRNVAGNTPLREAWCDACGVAPASALSAYRCITNVSELVELAKAEVASRDDELLARQLAAHWPKLQRLLSQDNMATSWDGVARLLDPPVLDLIQAAHFRLRHQASRTLPAGTISHLREKLDEAIRSVIDSKDVSDTLRAALLELLRQALHAVDDYAAFGIHGLERGMTMYGGLVAKHHKVLKANKGNAVARAALDVAHKVAIATAWANQNPGMITMLVGLGQIGAQLLSGIIPLLEGPLTPIIGEQLRLTAGEPIQQ